MAEPRTRDHDAASATGSDGVIASGDDDAGLDAPSDGAASGDEGTSSPSDDASVTDLTDAGAPSTPSSDAGTIGSVDAASGGGGGIDVPYPLPNSIDCASISGVLSCDDFGSSTRGATTVLEASGGGTADTSSGVAVLSTTRTTTTAAVQASFAAVFSGSLYLRFSMYIPSTVALDGVNFASLGELNTNGDFGLDLRFVDGGLVDLYTTGDDEVTAGYGNFVARDRWLCVLVAVENIDASGQVRVVIDGSDELVANGVDTEPPTGIVGAAAGIDYTFNGQADATLFVDNFLVTTQHPGACP